MTEKEKRITIKVEPEIHRNFGVKCKVEGTNMTDVLTQMIEAYLDPESRLNRIIEVRSSLKHNYLKLSGITPL